MELEIKLMWCKGLSAFNFFQKLTVYAAVSITSGDKSLKLTQDQKQEQKTPVDHEGNGNPEWNYPMKFDLSPYNISSNLHSLSLLFEIRNQGQLFGCKEIGEVRVPLKDLVESVGVGVGRFVSYEVRGPDGRHNGALDFSYKVMYKTNAPDLGNGVSDNHQDQIQISGCGSYQLENSSSSDDIQYPKLDLEAGPNQNPYPYPNPNPKVPSYWDPREQPPGHAYWGPSLPTPPHYVPPRPPPPHYLPPPPPPHQQPYPYRSPPPPPPYGDSYWGYQRPPPNYQQPTGGGYEYRQW